jgi:hypothetical protein
MPDDGESIQQLIESDIFAGSLVTAALRPVPVNNPDGSQGVDRCLDRGVPRGVRRRPRPETAAVMGFMAERAKARIEEVAASPASMVSQPEAVTRLI